MNICFFSDIHISKERGGVERVTNMLAEALQQRGNNVIMLSVSQPLDNDSLLSNQSVLPDKDICSQNNIVFVKGLLKEKEIDIIINQSETLSTYNLLKAVRGKSILITCIHNDPATIIKEVNDRWDLWRIKNGDLKYHLLYPYIIVRKKIQRYYRLEFLKDKYRKHYNNSDAIILLSSNYVEIFKKIISIQEDSKIHIIPNPVDFTLFNNVNSPKQNVVLFVGRLVYQKRIDRLLTIWNKVKHKEGWKLIIIGDGSDKSFFQEYNHKLRNNNVEFLGLQNPAPFYQEAKILCITSSYEGSPCVIQEALFNNVIPITFNSFEAANDYIENNKTGFLIEPFNIHKYAQTLSMLISDKTLVKEIKENIKKENICSKIGIEQIIPIWETLFERLRKRLNDPSS